MRYEIHGPLEVVQGENRLIPTSGKIMGKFWDEIDQYYDDASMGCGVYVFGLRSGGGVTPWYVGQTNKSCFRKEALSSSKRNYYNDAISNVDRGTPVLYLAVRITPGGRQCKPSRSGYRDIDFLEDYFIGAGLRKNPRIYNIKGTKMLRDIMVPGILNPEQANPGDAAISLRDTLHLV